ncbi:MAG: hypothetical protein K6357_07635 [Elusimicrobiota bacterium]
MNLVYVNLYNKERIIELLKILADLKYRIFSQGSTFSYLLRNGIEAEEVKSDVYHPNIAISSFLLGKKSKSLPSKPSLIIADILQDEIDDTYNLILLISAAKSGIPAICKYTDYEKVKENLKLFGEIGNNLKKELMFNLYSAIAFGISKKSYEIFPYLNITSEEITIPLKRITKLDCGENPHQRAFLFSSLIKTKKLWENIEILNGSLNLNHIIDINKAAELKTDIRYPACFSIRHSNISGFASSDNIYEAFYDMISNKKCEREIFVFNCEIDSKIINKLNSLNAEAVIASSYSQDVYKFIKDRNIKLKIIKMPDIINPPQENDIFYFNGDFVFQDKDIFDESQNIKLMTKRKPSIEEIKNISFLTALSKHSKTFSSIIMSHNKMLSISQSETTILDAIKTSIYKMNYQNIIKLDRSELMIAVDGSLDINSLNELTKLPIKIIIETGGNKEDEECIKICNSTNISLFFTKKRHFKHF